MQELAMWPGAKGKNWNCLDNWVSLYFDLPGKGGGSTLTRQPFSLGVFHISLFT